MIKELKKTDKERKKTRKLMSQKIGNINKEVEITERNQMEILELKNTVMEIKNHYVGSNSRFQMTKKKKKKNQ